MAARDHKPSRRALLGAAVAIPFVPFSRHCEDPGPEPGDAAIQVGGGDGLGAALVDLRSPSARSAGNDGDWREALAALREAEAAMRAFLERTAGAPDEAQEAVEAEMDARLDALGPALLRLLEAPAQDLEALAVKIETIVAHEAWSSSGGEACLANLARDARRLAGS
jgi:hypothetical protein